MSAIIRLLIRHAAVAGLLLCALMDASAEAAGAPFLWQVQGPKATHFLVGSIHLQPHNSSKLPESIIEAYHQSQGVVFETDIDALHSRSTQIAFAKKGKATSGGLQREVGDELYHQTQKGLRTMGLPANYCDQIRAWRCAISIEIYQWQQEGFDNSVGVDECIYAAASHDARQMRWLETPQQQIAIFTDMPDAMARDFLASSIDSSADQLDSPRALYRAWRENEVTALVALGADMHRRYPAIYDRLLTTRNRAWTPHLVELLGESSSQLIVVGAEHLVGPEGIVEILKAKGYIVTPVTTLAPLESAAVDPDRNLFDAQAPALELADAGGAARFR
jgi:uncharacterized protein YbaP (TraB family)